MWVHGRLPSLTQPNNKPNQSMNHLNDDLKNLEAIPLENFSYLNFLPENFRR